MYLAYNIIHKMISLSNHNIIKLNRVPTVIQIYIIIILRKYLTRFNVRQSDVVQAVRALHPLRGLVLPTKGRVLHLETAEQC